VQVKHKSTGAVACTVSKSDGRYAFLNLPAGPYELTIVMPCCAYKRFYKDVEAGAGQAAQLDLRLAETVTGTTLGDDPARLAATIQKRANCPVQACAAGGVARRNPHGYCFGR
jgi:hypothetical protein